MEKFQLGVFLRKIREDQRLSTRDLVRRVSKSDVMVTASQINKIENGKVNPGFQTLQKIAAALDLPLVIMLDGSTTSPDTVTIVSTPEVAEKLPQALQRAELVQLLLYCQQFNTEQVAAILSVAHAIRGVTQPLHEIRAVQEEENDS